MVHGEVIGAGGVCQRQQGFAAQRCGQGGLGGNAARGEEGPAGTAEFAGLREGGEGRCDAAGLRAQQCLDRAGRGDGGEGFVAQARCGRLACGRVGRAGGFREAGDHAGGWGWWDVPRRGERAEQFGHLGGGRLGAELQDGGDAAGDVVCGGLGVGQAERGEQAGEVGDAERQAQGRWRGQGERDGGGFHGVGEGGGVEPGVRLQEGGQVEHEAGFRPALAVPDRAGRCAAAVQQEFVQARIQRQFDPGAAGAVGDRADPGIRDERQAGGALAGGEFGQGGGGGIVPRGGHGQGAGGLVGVGSRRDPPHPYAVPCLRCFHGQDARPGSAGGKAHFGVKSGSRHKILWIDGDSPH